jgi:hypothetical protein
MEQGAGKQGLPNNQLFNVGRKEHLKGRKVKRL